MLEKRTWVFAAVNKIASLCPNVGKTPSFYIFWWNGAGSVLTFGLPLEINKIVVCFFCVTENQWFLIPWNTLHLFGGGKKKWQRVHKKPEKKGLVRFTNTVSSSSGKGTFPRFVTISTWKAVLFSLIKLVKPCLKLSQSPCTTMNFSVRRKVSFDLVKSSLSPHRRCVYLSVRQKAFLLSPLHNIYFTQKEYHWYVSFMSNF